MNDVNLNADELITMQQKRAYVQYGGSGPDNAVLYAGRAAQRMKIEGVSIPDANGGITPIWEPHPDYAKRYELVGLQSEPPELPAGTLVFSEKHGSIPRHWADLGCLTIFEVSGRCERLSDPNGWEDYVGIYENFRPAGAKDLGDRVPDGESGDGKVTASVPVIGEAAYAVGKLYFGEQSPGMIDREVMAVAFMPVGSCNNCDPEKAVNWLYRATRSSGAGSPGLPSEGAYSIDGGATWIEFAIDGIGATEDAVAMAFVGNKLVIVTKTAAGANAGGYYWAEINKYTGDPGAFTKVTAGFVAAFEPNDIYVLSAQEVYFCGDGGYIYKSTDIESGVTVLDAAEATSNDLRRIKGYRDTIVAVGDASTVIISQNRGATFATSEGTVSEIALSIEALGVKSDLEFWIGTLNSGRLLYTTNGGVTWAQKRFSGEGSGDLREIIWITPSVGFFAHNTSAPVGRIFATWNGGQTWTNAKPRIQTMPTIDHIRRMAAPYDADPTRAVNNLLAGGLNGNGSDGVLLLGKASIF
jgi:photosystem II stability/assembly factor-like uncharacterized protein